MESDLRRWMRLVEGEQPEALYHATSTSYLTSIIQHGLRPAIDRVKPDNPPAVFASPSLQYVNGYGGADETILQIDPSGNEWTKASRMEMTTLTPVLPAYLKILEYETTYIGGQRHYKQVFVPLITKA